MADLQRRYRHLSEEEQKVARENFSALTHNARTAAARRAAAVATFFVFECFFYHAARRTASIFGVHPSTVEKWVSKTGYPEDFRGAILDLAAPSVIPTKDQVIDALLVHRDHLDAHIARLRAERDGGAA